MEADLNLNEPRPAGARPEVILFDLDGTLRHNRPGWTETILDHAAELGVGLDPEQRQALIRWTHYYWAQSTELVADVTAFPERNADFGVQYVYRCLRQMHCDEAHARCLAPALQAYMSEMYRPIPYVAPDAPQTLASLKAGGYRLGVLSNRVHPIQDELTELNLLDYFDLVLVAGEVSSWKPDPLIFQCALERLELPPAAALYVGDNYYADIIGAQHAGLRPVLLDPDGLFPEADCPVIDTLQEVFDLL